MLRERLNGFIEKLIVRRDHYRERAEKFWDTEKQSVADRYWYKADEINDIIYDLEEILNGEFK